MIKKIVTYLLISIMSIQIILGIIWVVGNFNTIQQFGESYEYVEISDTYVIDEYIGVLYPVLIQGTKLLEKITSIPFFMFLYVLQLGIAIISTFYLTSLIINKKYRIVVGMYLTTIPMVLQFHMAILETSLVTSFTLCLIAKGLSMTLGLEEDKIKFEYGEVENHKKYLKWVQGVLIICILWVLTALLSPEYSYLSGIFVAVILLLASNQSHKENVEIRRQNIVVIKQQKNRNKVIIKTMTSVGIIFLTSMVIMGIENLTQKPGSRSKVEQSIEVSMFSRVVTPSLSSNYYFWPEEVKQIMTIEEARELSKRVDNVTDILGPKFEATFGKEAAKNYFKQMTIRCFQDRTKEVVERIWKDGVDYTLIPLTMMENIRGEGNSKTGWNFSRMKEKMPMFTTGFFLYGFTSLAFVVGLVVIKIFYLIIFKYGKNLIDKIIDFKQKSKDDLLSAINKREDNDKEGRNWKKKKAIVCGMPILTVILWYTLSSGEYVDYRNATIIIIFWYLYPIYFLVKEEWV